METVDITKKMEQLAQNPSFMEKVFAAKSVDDVKQLFIENDIEMDDDAAKSFLSKIQEDTDELTENEMESINGGILFCAAATIAGYAIIGATGGAIVGIGLLKLYKLLKYKK